MILISFRDIGDEDETAQTFECFSIFVTGKKTRTKSIGREAEIKTCSSSLNRKKHKFQPVFMKPVRAAILPSASLTSFEKRRLKPVPIERREAKYATTNLLKEEKK